jgi:hypothetical protein
MQPSDCRKDQTTIVDALLTLTLDTYQQSFGEQSFCLKVILLLLTANNPFLGRIICIQSIEASQFLSHHNSRHQSDQWRSSISYWRFQPVSYGIQIHQLILDIKSPTSWPFFFQLVFLDFHDVLYTIFNISTMCSRSEWTVMQLGAWTNAAWRLPLIRVQTVHWPLVLWLVWHHWMNFC